MPPRSLNRREYGEFKQMLEQALTEIRLPSGSVDADNIIPGSIRPQNCNMAATWNFSGGVTSNGVLLGNPINITTEETQTVSSTVNEVVEVNDRAIVGTADIYFLNALKQTVTLILPPVSNNVGRRIYVKRVDKDLSKICRVLTSGSDTLDDTDGVELVSHQAVILIASSKQWHVFSKLD
jgi:hypothetical protein|tara:strand:+ start:9909 stop:10448 length:540 start_codon:yes stop_codon:yes gene_type:complete